LQQFHPALVGAQGVVEVPLATRGSVRLHGELWRAESAEAGRYVAVGTTVVVREVRGLTLAVDPAPTPARRRVTLRPSRR
jgi:membrane protein implicated in regulation of membrane protease activity